MVARSTRNHAVRDDGAIDLASIMVGVLVMGILGSIIAAAVFMVIPWAQDSAAKSSIDGVNTAESVTRVQTSSTGSGTYADMPALVSRKLIQSSTKVAVGVPGAADCYVAVSRSDSGKVFWSTDKVRAPLELTGSSAVTCIPPERATVLGKQVSNAPVPAVNASAFKFGVAEPSSQDVINAAYTYGEYPGLVVTYADFSQPLDMAAINAVVAKGSRPVITWEPWLAGQGAVQPNFTLAKISNGTHDAYITSVANQLVAAGNPKVSIRFAHEMNGTWYPWAEQANGNLPGQYVTAWKHVVDIFDAKGLTNVDWVWAPNVPDSGLLAYGGLYPGSAYVDHTALDGFNFGTTNTSGSWTSHWTRPWDLFIPGLEALKAVAPDKRVYVAETASVSTEGADTQAVWVADMVYFLNHYGDDPTHVKVDGFVWFDFIKQETITGQAGITDWRVDSTSASIAAMKDALNRW